MASGQPVKHLAIVMDGNGRWASNRGLPRTQGHVQGAEVAIDITKYCVQQKIEVLTLFALSTENMSRPAQEVSFVVDLIYQVLLREQEMFMREGVYVAMLGQWRGLHQGLVEVVETIQTQTQSRKKMVLNLAVNYSGRWHIADALQRIQAEQAGMISGTACSLSQRLERQLLADTHGEPDMVIRTGGESRLSNFMLWHMAYSELFFESSYWPDITSDHIAKLMAHYDQRQRRFGQVAPASLSSA